MRKVVAILNVESISDAAKQASLSATFIYLSHQLNETTAVLSQGCQGVLIFVNDIANAIVLKYLRSVGVRVLFLRCCGYDRVDLEAAKELSISVYRVPSYSPHAVAEHAIALIMTLNRQTHRAFNRTREFDFSLKNLLGFNIYKKTVGIIGTGNIGCAFAKICRGFGANVIAYDVKVSGEALEAGVKYYDLNHVYANADIVSLHCPLTPNTRHMIDSEAIRKMKHGVMIINTSRGGLIDLSALVKGLKEKKIKSVGLDVIENEAEYFTMDFDGIIRDDTLARLFTFTNVLVTAHQAYFTEEALKMIAESVMENVKAYCTNTEAVSKLV